MEDFRTNLLCEFDSDAACGSILRVIKSDIHMKELVYSQF